MKQCKNCGFLSLRNTWTLALTEAHESFREKAHVITGHGDNLVHEDRIPVCFVRTASLQQEIGDKSDAQTVLGVIQKDRTNCEGHTPWMQGFTPKEHQEMVLSDTVLKIQQRQAEADRDEQRRREESDQRREDADRNWCDKQARKEHRWKIEESRWRRKELWVMGGIVTLVSVVAQIISAFIERGDLFKSQKAESTAKSPDVIESN